MRLKLVLGQMLALAAGPAAAEPGGGGSARAARLIGEGYAGYIEDGDRASRIHNLLQKIFHYHLGSCTIQCADNGKGENAIPNTNNRCGNFGYFVCLAKDDFLTSFNKGFESSNSKGVDQFIYLQ